MRRPSVVGAASGIKEILADRQKRLMKEWLLQRQQQQQLFNFSVACFFLF